MSDLLIEIACLACGRRIKAAFSELEGHSARCPACGAAVPVTEERLEAVVERRMQAERKASKPKFRGL